MPPFARIIASSSTDAAAALSGAIAGQWAFDAARMRGPVVSLVPRARSGLVLRAVVSGEETTASRSAHERNAP